MPNPFSWLRGKLGPRIGSVVRRKWHWKDVALLVMALLLVSVGGYAFREPIAVAVAKLQAQAQGGETVSVFDVVLDRENRQFVDILFDRPLGEGKVDEIVDPLRPRSSPPSAVPGNGRTPTPCASSRAAASPSPANTRSA